MASEKRLIYANEALRMMENSRYDNPFFNGNTRPIWEMAHECAISCVEACPTVDAVEVIRCKNCEHSRKWGNEGTLLCYRDETTVHIVKPDAYCDGSQRRYAADDPEVLKFEPVVPGHWIQEVKGTYIPAEFDENDNLIVHQYVTYKCSVCGRYERVKEPYCNCGAKMDQEVDYGK